MQLADDWRGKLSPLEVARKKAMGSLQPGISKAGGEGQGHRPLWTG